MATPDISRLKIDREAKAPASGLRPKRRRRGRMVLLVLAVVMAAAAAMSVFAGKPAVEVVAVAQTYPAQNYTLLNATGYVVAQRKAALSSKACLLYTSPSPRDS